MDPQIIRERTKRYRKSKYFDNIQVNQVDSTDKPLVHSKPKKFKPEPEYDVTCLMKMKSKIDDKLNSMESANQLPTLYFNHPVDSKYILISNKNRETETPKTDFRKGFHCLSYVSILILALS